MLCEETQKRFNSFNLDEYITLMAFLTVAELFILVQLETDPEKLEKRIRELEVAVRSLLAPPNKKNFVALVDFNQLLTKELKAPAQQRVIERFLEDLLKEAPVKQQKPTSYPRHNFPRPGEN